MPKNELRIPHNIIQKSKLKMNQRPNVRQDNTKFLVDSRKKYYLM